MSSKMMQNKALLLSVFLGIVLFGQIAFSAGDYASLSLSILKYEPVPAQPNSYIDLWMKLDNTGSKDARNVTLEFVEQFPFSIDSGFERSYNIGSVPGFQSVVKKFRVKIDKNAVEGENEIKFRYSLGTTQGSWIERSVTIDVKRQDSLVMVEKVFPETNELRPGERSSINVVVKNTASTLVRDVTVELSLGNSPIYTIGETNKKRISRIDAGEEKTLNYRVVVDPISSPGVYPLTINITYYDNTGEKHSLTYESGVIVSEEPKLTLVEDVNGFLVDGKAQTIGLKFVNNGNIDLKYVSVEIGESEGYSLLSPSLLYVGNIDSDDFERADIEVYIDKEVKEIEVPVHINYRDSLNREYDINKTLSFKVYSPSELSEKGLVEKGSGWKYLFIAVVLVLAYAGYRKLRRKKK